MSVKVAKLADLPKILELSLKLFEYERRWGRTFNLDWTYSSVGKNYFRKRIKDGEVFIAEANGRIVGYLACHAFRYPFRSTNPIFELENMYVEEEFRNAGIGRDLVTSYKQLAKQKGVGRLQVVVIFQNAEAIKFYKKMGLTEFNIVLESKPN